MVFIDDYDDESSSTVLRRLQPASAASDSSDVEASSIESMTGDHTEQEKLEETNLVEDSDHWQAVHDMAKRETKSIRVWRLVVILTLLVLGACISTLVYTILRAEEESDFNDTVSNSYSHGLQTNLRLTNCRSTFCLLSLSLKLLSLDFLPRGV